MTDRIAELRALLERDKNPPDPRWEAIYMDREWLDKRAVESLPALLDCASALREIAPDHPALKGLENG